MTTPSDPKAAPTTSTSTAMASGQHDHVDVDGSIGGAMSVAGYAGGSSFDVPNFWQAVCRYRERHGLTNAQQKPILTDDDLRDLRDTSAPRDFSFDDADLPPSSR
jgi:hypothetical protein